MTESASLAPRKAQGSIYLIGVGHSTTHWVGTAFLVLLPYLTRELGLSYTAAGVLVSIRHISSLVANVGSGAVVDLVGRRITFLVIALALNSGAMLMLGFTNLYVAIAVTVAVLGASSNMWHPAAISYLSTEYPQRRAYALSIHATGARLGDMLAPMAAGAMLVAFSWQQTAAAAAVPGFVMLVVFWVLLLPRDRADAAVQAAGAAGHSYLAGLAYLVRQRAFAGLCLTAGLRAMAQTGLRMFLPLYLADVMGASPVVLGTAVMAMHLGGAMVTPLVGTLADRIGPRRIVMAGLAAAAVAVGGITFIPNTAAFVGAVLALGLVFYAVQPVMLSWMMDFSPPHLRGTATSLMFGAQAALSAFIPVVGGMVADVWGLTEVFYLLAAVICIASLSVLVIPKQPRA